MMQDTSFYQDWAGSDLNKEDASYYSSFLDAMQLVDSPPEEAFDKFTRLVQRFISVPVALVSIVEEPRDRQYFKSEIGLSGKWKEARQTPLTHSFCQIVKNEDKPLIVEDAPNDLRVCSNLAIPDLGVRAYLGIPIHAPNGAPMGALCAIDDAPRRWLESDIEGMVDLAACVDDLIRLRTALFSANGLSDFVV